MQLQKVTKPGGTVNPHKNAILHCCAEAHSKTVCPCAWSVVSWPGVQDETSTLPKYICGTSYKTENQRKKALIIRFIYLSTPEIILRLLKRNICKHMLSLVNTGKSRPPTDQAADNTQRRLHAN